MEQTKPVADTKTANPNGIVSVNSRGGSSSNLYGKLAFILMVLAIIAIGALLGFNKYRAAKKSEQTAAEQSAKYENKPATVGQRRSFDTDPPPLPAGALPKGTTDIPTGMVASTGSQLCADGMPGTVMLGADGKAMMSPGGLPMRVCKDGHVIVPAVQTSSGAQPIPLAGNTQVNGTPPPSRYAGDVMVTTPGALGGALMGNTGQLASPNDPMSIMASILGQTQKSALNANPIASGIVGVSGPGGNGATNPPGALGNLLTPSLTPKVTASMLGDRNMILPKGRTIDCGLSMRIITEVSGMASCILPQNIYSDNGRVVLLERGSEATGEYSASMQQGQRRLFVLWTRIKTPDGVIINLDSPAADALGTMGMDGYVDNHWWDRLGAAFLLSMVQDAIAYEVAKNTPPGGTTVYANTASTGSSMAEKVLASTINIKPTLYKNQGDRCTIYVARDLDFGSVYALRAH